MELNTFKKSALALSLLSLAPLGCGRMGGGGSHGAGSDQMATDVAKVPAGAVDPAVERYKVAVGDAPLEGAAVAKVTIIEFSDFQ